MRAALALAALLALAAASVAAAETPAVPDPQAPFGIPMGAKVSAIPGARRMTLLARLERRRGAAARLPAALPPRARLHRRAGRCAGR